MTLLRSVDKLAGGLRIATVRQIFVTQTVKILDHSTIIQECKSSSFECIEQIRLKLDNNA
jgi:hypothetical protein